jgi:hypothetical protein
LIFASVKSGFAATTDPSKFLNEPSTNEIPRCLTEKLTKLCRGSIVHLVCEKSAALIEMAIRNKNIFFMFLNL